MTRPRVEGALARGIGDFKLVACDTHADTMRAAFDNITSWFAPPADLGQSSSTLSFSVQGDAEIIQARCITHTPLGDFGERYISRISRSWRRLELSPLRTRVAKTARRDGFPSGSPLSIFFTRSRASGGSVHAIASRLCRSGLNLHIDGCRISCETSRLASRPLWRVYRNAGGFLPNIDDVGKPPASPGWHLLDSRYCSGKIWCHLPQRVLVSLCRLLERV